jgi:hypothetical protein
MCRPDSHCGLQGALRRGDAVRRQLRFRNVGRALRLTNKVVRDTAVPRLPPTLGLLRLDGNA